MARNPRVVKKTMTKEKKERRKIKRKKWSKMTSMSVARKKRANERELYTVNVPQRNIAWQK